MSFCVLAHINSNLMETINNIQKVSCLRFVRLPHAGQGNYIEFDNTDGYVISLASHLCTIKFLCTNGGNMDNVWVVAWLVVIFMQNIMYESCYYLFVLLLANAL